MTKAKIALLIFVGILFILISYRYRAPLAGWIWHIRHGNSVTISNYIVPVPRNWYIESENGVGQILVRVDTDNPAPRRKIKAYSSMFLDEMPRMRSVQEVRSKIAIDVAMMKRQGSDEVMERTVHLNDGVVVYCAGGYRPGSGGNFDVEPVAWFCGLPGLGLTIRSTEGDMKQVWDVVSHIRLKVKT